VIAAVTGTKALWYLTRGTGVVSLVLLSTTFVLGIVEVSRWRSRSWPRFVTAGLHRNLSLLAVAFVGIHIATTVIDGFAPIGWLDAVVPFRSPYRPMWLGLGAVALDLQLALVVTSLLRATLGFRVWRAVHWVAYACWPVALAHAVGTGSDVRSRWALAVGGFCLLGVMVATAFRLAMPDDTASPLASTGVGLSRRVRTGG
jgi:predicted ferric reductase